MCMENDKRKSASKCKYQHCKRQSRLKFAMEKSDQNFSKQILLYKYEETT
jgi:hypothetical protein